MSNAIEIKNVTKRFKEFTLNDVSFELPKGYIMGFIGPNGAGKTTTIKLILNMLKRDSGTIKVLGLDNIDDESKVKEEVAVVFDQPYYIDEWNLNDVEKAVGMFYKKWDGKVFDSYLKRFGLSRSKKVKDLSRGMKMKLMIAVAFSHNAKVLILDEPTGGLDPVARDEFIELLGEYIQDGDRSVIFSTHITSDLEKIADYITFIRKGKIIYTGTKDELLEKYCIIKGGNDDIMLSDKKNIIGLREHSTGFEGLIDVENLRGFSNHVITEKATLDDIVVYMNKEDH
ncbi:ABC transporter ATP-binding protein [Clostridium cadaveris]|uniref:ABC transporter ATP-binding protein n=1 Tax=Clostridium cadaveris TaxID=1529 RepID=UPI0031E38FEC